MPDIHAKDTSKPRAGGKSKPSVSSSPEIKLPREISSSREIKSPRESRSSHEVTANDVIDNLLGLFERLGIDAPRPLSRAATVRARDVDPRNLYSFTTEICELLTAWHQDPEYLDHSGEPAPIKLRGARASFRKLARRTVPELDDSYLLSELERLGAVRIDEQKCVHVLTRSFPMYEDERLAAQHTLTTLDDFIRTLRHNLDSAPSNSDQLFHRIAWNGNFDDREIPTLKIRARRHGQNFLESFDNWLTRKSLPKSRQKRPPLEHARIDRRLPHRQGR